MNKNLLLLGLLSCGLSSSALAEETATTNKGTESTVKSESKDDDGKVEKLANALSRFSIGGYGEAVTSRNFYSQHFNRYRDPATYKNDKCLFY